MAKALKLITGREILFLAGHALASKANQPDISNALHESYMEQLKEIRQRIIEIDEMEGIRESA